MPATEQTWRVSKLMHLIFGISALAMLITTIWMLAADHRRNRTILVTASGDGAAVKLLEDLSDREIDEFLSAARLRRK